MWDRVRDRACTGRRYMTKRLRDKLIARKARRDGRRGGKESEAIRDKIMFLEVWE